MYMPVHTATLRLGIGVYVLENNTTVLCILCTHKQANVERKRTTLLTIHRECHIARPSKDKRVQAIFC